jgi:hypothetical protein
MNWEGYKTQLCSNLRYYPGICLEILKKTTIKINQHCWFTHQDLNTGPPKLEVGMLRM